MLGAALVFGTVMVLLLVAWLSGDNSEDLASPCRLEDRRTVVACNEAHQWELIGSTDLRLNLASYSPYPTEQAMWFVLYNDDCAQLALEAASPEQVLPEDVAIVAIPISTPTFREWEDGDRVVTCAIGVESAADAEANPRAADVEPITGSGSLLLGEWVATGSS